MLKKYGIFVFTLFVFGFCLLVWSGLCFSRLSYLSSEDLIRIALQSQIKMDKDILPSWVKEPDDIRKLSKGCCGVDGRRDPMESWWTRLLGCQKYTVSVGYLLGEEPNKIESNAIYEMDRCGKILNVVTMRP